MANEKNLYLVQDGEVTQVDAGVDFDGQASVLCLASDASAALELARRYDGGLIQPDNVNINGSTIAALS
jgi:hypothetical protein